MNDNITIDGVTRPATDAEQAALETAREEIANDLEAIAVALETKITAQESARKKLADLGLTEKEISALLGA